MYVPKFWHKLLKTLALFCVIVFLWLYFVHEPSHYFACCVQGGQSTIAMFALSPHVMCTGTDLLSPAGRLIYVAAPYWVDLAALIALAFVKRRSILLKLLPHAAFFDFLSNFAGAKIAAVDYDFQLIRAMNPAAEIMLLVAIVLVWVVFYGRDLTRKIVDSQNGSNRSKWLNF